MSFPIPILAEWLALAAAAAAAAVIAALQVPYLPSVFLEEALPSILS